MQDNFNLEKFFHNFIFSIYNLDNMSENVSLMYLSNVRFVIIVYLPDWLCLIKFICLEAIRFVQSTLMKAITEVKAEALENNDPLIGFHINFGKNGWN